MVIGWDTMIFEWINTGWSSSVLDAILIPMRNKYTWVPAYVFIIAFLMMNHGKRGYYMVIALIITVGVADLTSNYGFKKTVERLRPCRSMAVDDVIVRVRCGSGFSFTSNHAANHFALSTFLWLLIGGGGWRYMLLLWAAMIAIAQVYVGVHYPSDVVCGAVLGYFIARLCYAGYSRYLMPVG